jgi:hypothetical protein
VSQSSGLDVAALVSVALAAAQNAPGASVIPTVLLERVLLKEREPQRGAGLANATADWLRELAFMPNEAM